MSDKPALREDQLVDLTFGIANKRVGFLHDPGVGKTPPVCVLLYWHATQGRRSIWTQPKSLLKKNYDELLRFTHFRPEDIVIVDGNAKEVGRAIASDAKVFLVGFDRLKRSWSDLRTAHPDIEVIAVDEWHMGYSTHGSQRTQHLYDIMRSPKMWLIGMTGTLIKGRLSSAYPLFHMIEPRYYAGLKDFMRQHAIVDAYDNVVGWQGHDKIAAIAAKHCIRRSFTDVYGPEAKVIFTERCEMSPKQRGTYKEFEDKAVLELEDDMLTAVNGGVFVLRCRQIMQHPETWGLAEGEKTGKDELLEVHLEDHKNDGKPIVIFACFVPEQERLVKLVQSKGMTVALLNGNTPTKRRAQIDEDFRAGKIQVLVGSPAVATVGFNWQHVDHCVFTSISYMDDEFYQAYRRFIRGKRETPLRITVLEYAKSIDQRLFRIIQRKSADANKVDGREVYVLGAKEAA